MLNQYILNKKTINYTKTIIILYMYIVKALITQKNKKIIITHYIKMGHLFAHHVYNYFASLTIDYFIKNNKLKLIYFINNPTSIKKISNWYKSKKIYLNSKKWKAIKTPILIYKNKQVKPLNMSKQMNKRIKFKTYISINMKHHNHIKNYKNYKSNSNVIKQNINNVFLTYLLTDGAYNFHLKTTQRHKSDLLSFPKCSFYLIYYKKKKLSKLNKYISYMLKTNTNKTKYEIFKKMLFNNNSVVLKPIKLISELSLNTIMYNLYNNTKITDKQTIFYTHINPMNKLNNYTPQIYTQLNNSKQNLCKYTNLQFFSWYCTLFLENFFKKKIYLKCDNNSLFSKQWQKFIEIKNTTYLYTYKRLIKYINIHEFLEIIILSFIKKDCNMLLFFLKYTLEKNHFKWHKKILSLFFDILRKNNFILPLTNVKGFSFDIRGKVGVSGNAKKRHNFFSIGKITTTSQNLKSHWQQLNVWTPTGQMGMTILIQY